MIMAAGFGTRLRPLTDELPKPAVPVANRPLAWFALDHLARSGVTEVAINTHHLADRLQERLAPHVPDSVRPRFLHEPEILGTGGGVRNAWRPPDDATEPFLVMNGDVIFAPDLDGLLDIHRRLGAIATMVVRKTPDPERYGAVEVDAGHRVRRLLGEPQKAPGSLQRYMFAGTHLLHPRAWAGLPEKGCIIRESYRRWIDGGEVVAAVVEEGPWVEVGTPHAYLDANCRLADGGAQWNGIDADANGVIADDSCEYRGATVRSSVLGPGVRVADGTRLQRVVVWEGVHVKRDARDAVLTPSGIVQLQNIE
jgi:NDP-sugar pyrophosphorylase family protein